MIADRRKDQAKTAKRGTKKAATTSDRSIATGRAKRDAAAKARRGMTQDKKPSAMEVDREVYRQSRKTATAKSRAEQKASGGRLPVKKAKKGTAAAGKKKAPPPAGVAVTGGRPPSKKQVEAAVKAMASIGAPVPKGHQLVLTFVPTFQQNTAPATKTTQPKNNKKGGGQGGGAKSKPQNNNNARSNRNNNGRGYNKK
ncbi:MAG: hypothetical protein SGARI_005390 [Bacillariaceae sp.]